MSALQFRQRHFGELPPDWTLSPVVGVVQIQPRARVTNDSIAFAKKEIHRYCPGCAGVNHLQVVDRFSRAPAMQVSQADAEDRVEALDVEFECLAV